jgi:hypothetical protein
MARHRKQRWKIHQCETCERWTSAGVMVSAGEGSHRPGSHRHRVYKWLCDDCKRSGDNLRAVDQALAAWEVERGYGASV